MRNLEGFGHHCIDCGTLLPDTEFHHESDGTLVQPCAACSGVRRDIGDKTLRHAVQQSRAARRYDTPWMLATAAFCEQKGECAGCGQQLLLDKATAPNGALLDHDHEKGSARGWLCDGCNRAAGRTVEDAKALQAYADYFSRPAFEWHFPGRSSAHNPTKRDRRAMLAWQGGCCLFCDEMIESGCVVRPWGSPGAAPMGLACRPCWTRLSAICFSPGRAAQIANYIIDSPVSRLQATMSERDLEQAWRFDDAVHRGLLAMRRTATKERGHLVQQDGVDELLRELSLARGGDQ
jgi:hypothetical protein